MPYIDQLIISRWRTFGEPVSFEFQYPKDGHLGPNLNIVVGRNNAGKSTIVQAFKFIAGNDENIVVQKSDRRTDNGIFVEFKLNDGQTIVIEQSTLGAAHKRSRRLARLKIVESRRPWQTSSTAVNRMAAENFWLISSGQRTNYDERNDWTYQNSFAMFAEIASDKNKLDAFNSALKEVFPFINEWRLESDLGKYFIEYKSDAAIWHSIALVGEGMINSFLLMASLYDISNSDVVVIDEPELSLHPQAQKRLFNFLVRKSKTAQIIVSTHSPHFITWDSIGSGIKLFRIKPGANAKAGTISQATASALRDIAVKDFKNRRMFDALSRELFFF